MLVKLLKNSLKFLKILCEKHPKPLESLKHKKLYDEEKPNCSKLAGSCRKVAGQIVACCYQKQIQGGGFDGY